MRRHKKIENQTGCGCAAVQTSAHPQVLHRKGGLQSDHYQRLPPLLIAKKAVRRGCLPPDSNAHVALRGSLERCLQRPPVRGGDYMNRKSYNSVLLGIVDA
ncbi:unnamed protein product [Arctogadus glacialis]